MPQRRKVVRTDARGLRHEFGSYLIKQGQGHGPGEQRTRIGDTHA